MEIYPVFMTQSATQDLMDMSSYIAYELKEPPLAKKFLKKLKASILDLAKLPLRYALVSDESLAAQGFRKIVVDSYIIFYIISDEEKTVSIIRILYGRRDWIHMP